MTGPSYDDLFTPRIILLSDGEADNPTWRGPLDFARSQGIIIDVIALLSADERGKATLEEIATTTSGSFMMPGDIDKFISEFARLSKKKQATKVEDIILCLDTSGSMGETYKGAGKKKIKALKEAVVEFARKKLSIDPRDRVGIVIFGSYDGNKAAVLVSLGPYNEEQLLRVVDKLKAQNGTPLDRGLHLAIQELDLAAKRAHLHVVTAVPLNHAEDLPGGQGTCKYCSATGKPQPGITPDTWHFYEGIRNVMVFRCPSCNALYHGMCFDKHVTRGGNHGVCYGCNAVLTVSQDLAIQTPATASAPASPGDSLLLMCPTCNEPLPPGARFCSHCGQRIDQVAPSPAPGTLAPKGAPGTLAPKGAPGYVTPVMHAEYDPASEGLVTCRKCGYSCAREWESCPICDELLPPG